MGSSIRLVVTLEISFSPLFGDNVPVLISDVWSLYIKYQNILLLLSQLGILNQAETCVLYPSYMYDR